MVALLGLLAGAKRGLGYERFSKRSQSSPTSDSTAKRLARLVALSRLTRGVVRGSFTRRTWIAFGHGCDCSSYVGNGISRNAVASNRRIALAGWRVHWRVPAEFRVRRWWIFLPAAEGAKRNANAEHLTADSRGCPEATQSHIKATSKPPQSMLAARRQAR